MNVAELIMELESMPEGAEVRLAIQPSWPFQHSIQGVALVEPQPQPVRQHSLDNEEAEEDYLDAFYEWQDDQTGEPVVYIAEGGQLYSAPYLPGAASLELGWG